MADLTTEMRSGPCTLALVYSVIGLSLWMLNTDIVEHLAVVSPVSMTTTLEGDSTNTSLQQRVRYTNKLSSEARRASHRAALEALLTNTGFRPGSETSIDGVTARRRKAAFALLVFATVESSRGAPG